ncbi:hypothetical protein E2C01_092429 [Portunus trituberculatus]|uniref:Uncharacterized protein n=1 Tax=Portunus trituberculatus TaxID=210409 RepID=A0A5B7JRC3_PORTR|nr:hypothetical protein [Portunus trituberculatus]
MGDELSSSLCGK